MKKLFNRKTVENSTVVNLSKKILRQAVQSYVENFGNSDFEEEKADVMTECFDFIARFTNEKKENRDVIANLFAVIAIYQELLSGKPNKGSPAWSMLKKMNEAETSDKVVDIGANFVRETFESIEEEIRGSK